MKKIIRILILCLSCIGACWLLPACSSALEEPESGGGGDGSTVTLTIQAAVPDGTRADGSEVPDREKIDQLRIIVVDQTTHKVEHNQLHGFSYPEDEYNIEVEKNSTKDVYFLANAESWCSNIPGVGGIYNPDEDESEGDEGDDGIIEARTNTMPSLFNQEITDLPDKLPYTSKYKIEVEDKNVAATCYIAIAAVKFLVKITNKTGAPIEISSLQIAGTANKSYLFPHLEEGQWDQWINSVIEQDGNYITAYNIPDDATHSPFTLSDEAISINSDETSVIGPAYSHESKLLFAIGSSTEQHYTIQFQIDGTNYYAEIEDLKSLIRNTYVIINININQLEIVTDHEIVIWGKIEDWYEEEMEGGLEEVEAPQISLLTY